jgi:PKHD-type hydroxylase
MIGSQKVFDRNYIRVLKPATLNPWAYQLNYFTPAECDEIIALGLELETQAGNLGTGRTVDNQVRQSTVSFFRPSDTRTEWIFNRINVAVDNFNRQFWNFDLKFVECLQFARYDQPGDFYCSHMDMFYDQLEIRKLSISVQLSDAREYQGSDLRMLRYGQEYDCAPRDRGSIIVFPSYQVHEVTPLIAGSRYSMVAWVVGPPFR